MNKILSTMRQTLMWLSLLLFAEICSYKGIYELFIIPKLADTSRVPDWWWIIASSPVIVTLAFAGWFIPSWQLALTYSAGGALATTALQWLAALRHQPGLHKVVEGGLFHFLIQLLVLTLLFEAIVLSSQALATWSGRRTPSA